jgi:hypothetical protein
MGMVEGGESWDRIVLALDLNRDEGGMGLWSTGTFHEHNAPWVWVRLTLNFSKEL